MCACGSALLERSSWGLLREFLRAQESFGKSSRTLQVFGESERAQGKSKSEEKTKKKIRRSSKSPLKILSF